MCTRPTPPSPAPHARPHRPQGAWGTPALPHTPSRGLPAACGPTPRLVCALPAVDVTAYSKRYTLDAIGLLLFGEAQGGVDGGGDGGEYLRLVDGVMPAIARLLTDPLCRLRVWEPHWRSDPQLLRKHQAFLLAKCEGLRLRPPPRGTIAAALLAAKDDKGEALPTRELVSNLGIFMGADEYPGGRRPQRACMAAPAARMHSQCQLHHCCNPTAAVLPRCGAPGPPHAPPPCPRVHECTV